MITPGYTATYNATSVMVQRTGNSADFDLDGDTDGDDFLTWQRNVGTFGFGTQLTGDANLDTSVNAADLAIWRTQFLASPMLIAASAPGPEPGMLAMIAIAVPALVGAASSRLKIRMTVKSDDSEFGRQ